MTGLILTTIVVIAAFPAWVRFQRDHSIRVATASEYRADRSVIMSEIGEAIANQDLDALQRIHKKYAGYVSDSQFKAVIEDGLATLTTRQTQAELAVAKMLDISRHREELGNRHFLEQQKKETKDAQQLSVLPR